MESVWFCLSVSPHAARVAHCYAQDQACRARTAQMAAWEAGERTAAGQQTQAVAPRADKHLADSAARAGAGGMRHGCQTFQHSQQSTWQGSVANSIPSRSNVSSRGAPEAAEQRQLSTAPQEGRSKANSAASGHCHNSNVQAPGLTATVADLRIVRLCRHHQWLLLQGLRGRIPLQGAHVVEQHAVQPAERFLRHAR